MSYALAGFRFQLIREGAVESLEEDTKTALHSCASLFRELRAISRFYVLAAQLPFPALILAQPVEDGAWATDAMRAFALAHSATCVWTCAEVWMRNAPLSEIAKYRRGDLAKDPQAVEKVMVVRESPHTQPHHTLWLASIDRAHGRPKLLAWHQTTNVGGSTEGTMTYVLPPCAYGKTGAA